MAGDEYILHWNYTDACLIVPWYVKLSIRKLKSMQWLVIKHCIQGSLHYCGGLVPTPMFQMIRLIFIFIEPQVLLAFCVFLSPSSCLCATVSTFSL